MTPGLVLLCSYPKSGNTWLRFVLETIRNNGTPPEINKISIPNAASRAEHDDALDMETSDLDPAEVGAARAWVLQHRHRTELTLLKAHDANLAPPGVANSPFAAGSVDRAIYLVRDPRDVAVSCAIHFGISFAETVANLCDDAFMIGRSMDHPNANVEQFISSWSRHVESWLDTSDLPVRCIRYEDLLEDPLQAFAAAAAFAGLPSDAALVQRAVASSSFSSLSEAERNSGFRERHPAATAPFFRNGKAGEWRETMPATLAAEIARVHGPVMRRLGYPI